MERSNNFDFLRLLASSAVVISHSFIVTGHRSKEIFTVLTNHQTELGEFAVKIFFAISGFLVFQSMERSSNYLQFLTKRILRIFPGLVAMLLLTMLAVPFLYSGNGNVFSENSYYSCFFKSVLLYYEPQKIKGVFSTHPFQEINMSLWTLSYEFTMYLLIGLMVFIKKRNVRFLLLSSAFLVLTCLAVYWPVFLNGKIFPNIGMQSYYFYDLASFFVMGSILNFVEVPKSKTKNLILLGSFLLILISLGLHLYPVTKFFLVPLFAVFFGIQSFPLIKNVGNSFGDLSYGIYIYGWFIQQIVLSFFKVDSLSMMLVSLPVSILFAWFSWHFVEKKMLKLKSFIR